MSKYNIHILTALWKRPDITNLFIQGVKRLGFDCTASISEESYISVCDANGINWIMTPNKPLGAKWNAGLREALNHEWDYLLILGSDDLISNDLIYRYMSYEGWDMIGVRDLYLYKDGRVKYFASKRLKTIGAGRLLKRSAIEKCGMLWSDHKNKGLDGNCSKRLRMKRLKEVAINMGDSIVVDIKSDVNMNSFDKLEGEIVNKKLNLPEL